MTDHRERLIEIIEDARVCMLTDRFRDGLRARPMAPLMREGDGKIYFVIDRDAGTTDEIARNPEICLSVQDGTTYASITGDAMVAHDAVIIEDLWNTALDAWFPNGPKDSDIRLLVVSPKLGEYWDGPSRIVAGIKMALASATDSKPDMGDNAKASFADAQL